MTFYVKDRLYPKLVYYNNILNTNFYSYHRHLDVINVMAYDLNGGWNNWTAHNSPLYHKDIEVGSGNETLNVVSIELV